MANDAEPITPGTEPSAPDRNLALELARVTEAAALAAGRWVGRGDKNGADGAAVSAMRQLISTESMTLSLIPFSEPPRRRSILPRTF